MTQATTPPWREPAAALGRNGLGGLLRDLVDPLAGRALRGVDLLAALAAEDADETTDGVLLPPRDFDDFGQRRTLGTLIIAITSAILLLRDSVVLFCAREKTSLCVLIRSPRSCSGLA